MSLSDTHNSCLCARAHLKVIGKLMEQQASCVLEEAVRKQDNISTVGPSTTLWSQNVESLVLKSPTTRSPKVTQTYHTTIFKLSDWNRAPTHQSAKPTSCKRAFREAILNYQHLEDDTMRHFRLRRICLACISVRRACRRRDQVWDNNRIEMSSRHPTDKMRRKKPQRD